MIDNKYGFSLDTNIEKSMSNIENYPYSNLDVALESELGLLKSDYYDIISNLSPGTEGFIESIGTGIKNIIKWFWDKLVAIFNFITGRSKKNKKLSALDIYKQEMAAVKKIMDAYDTTLDTLIKTVRDDGDWTKEDEKYPLYLSMYNEKDKMLNDKKSFYVIEPNIAPEDLNVVFDECKALVVRLGEIIKETSKLDTFLEDAKSSESDLRKIIGNLSPKIDRLKSFRHYHPKKVSNIEDVKRYQKEFKNIMSIILKRTQDIAVTSEKVYNHLLHLKFDKITELEKSYVKNNNMNEEEAYRRSMRDINTNTVAILFKDITDVLFNFKALKTVLLRASIADMKICINHNKKINPKAGAESMKYGFSLDYDLIEEGTEGLFTDFILKLAEKGSERSEKEARERAKNYKYEPSDLEKLVKQHSAKLMREVKPYGTKIAKMLPKSKEFKILFNNIKKETIRDYGIDDWKMIENDLYYFECNPELYDDNISVLSYSQDLMSYDGWDEFEALMVSEFNKISSKLKAPNGYKWIFTGPYDDETSIWCTLEEADSTGNESFKLFNDDYKSTIDMNTIFDNIKDSFNKNKNYPWASPEAAIESALDKMSGYEFSKYIESMEIEYEGTEGIISGAKSIVKWFINLIKKFFNWITGRNKKEEKTLKELNAALKLQLHSLQKSTGIKQQQDNDKIKRLEDEIEKLKDKLHTSENSEKSSKDTIDRLQVRINEYEEKLRKEKEVSYNLKTKLQNMSKPTDSTNDIPVNTPIKSTEPQYWAPTGIDFSKSIEIMEVVEKTFNELCSVMLGAYNWDECIERLEKSSLNNKFIDNNYSHDIRNKLDELEKNLNMINAKPYSSKNEAIKITEDYKQYYNRYKSFKEQVSKKISTVHSVLRNLLYDNSYNLKKHNTKSNHETKSNITVFIKIIYPKFEDNHSKLISKVCDVVYDCYYKNKEN